MVEQTVPSRRILISGKFFTWTFAGSLLASLLILIPVVLRFGYIQDSLEETRQKWPKAAVYLRARYDAIEAQQSKSSKAISEDWKRNRRKFDELTIYDEQRPISRRLDELALPILGELNETEIENGGLALPLHSDDYVEFITAENRLRSAYSDWIGRLTSILFRLRAP